MTPGEFAGQMPRTLETSAAPSVMDSDNMPVKRPESPEEEPYVDNAALQAMDNDEVDWTSRSEEPRAFAAPPQLLSDQPDAGYFSPRPLRPYGARLPASTPVSSRPSPTASIDSPSASPAIGHLRSAFNRPAVQRDDSNASTASIATVRAHSVDTTKTFVPFSRHQLDGPYYPNQSYAALQSQPYPSKYPPISRKGGSYHGHNQSLSAAHIRTSGLPSEHRRDIMDTGSRTVGNSPVSSPGLFSPSPTTPPLRHVRQPDDGFYSSPYLHHTHRQAPKETHIADVDVDPVSGRKIINQYEVMDELGRGVHGKVKLGRNLETGLTVAIKIVDRFSKKRRLNKDTSREDKIKREIAILKKARHPNIVSLLEVIDDPTRKKVYIVLEHVELGEVRWRTEGEKEICLIEWRRYQRECHGDINHESAAMEDEKIMIKAHKSLARQQRHTARLLSRNRSLHTGIEGAWSLEHGGESDEEIVGSLGSLASGRTSRASARKTKGAHPQVHAETTDRPFTPSAIRSQDEDSSTGLEGTMYGAYDSEFARGRTASLADSSCSYMSAGEDEIPEHFRYVPLLTLQAALESFRDTVLGLEFLHFQEVVHRDIKPANLLQTKEHRIKISDFGVSYLGRARLETDNCEYSDSDMLDAEAIELAKTVGTPAFYAPELCKLDDDGDPLPVTKQIDIWALGVTLYCLVYGRVPFYEANEFMLMKTIVEEEVVIPQYRLKAVTEQSGSRPSSHGRMYSSMTTDRRAPHELAYDEVDELLRDLLKRLLIKDPRQRITIPEIKRHPWVLQGLDNFDSWVEGTDPSRTYQGRRIEVSKDDMEQAVVPINLFDRMRSGMRKTLDTVFRTVGRTGSRKRAESAATSPDPSHSISARSSSSTISQDSRRPSLALNQSIFEALSRSRESNSEHPLSHSVSVSPEATERAKFFEPNSRTGSPAHPVDRHEYHVPQAGAIRPFAPERGYSDMSSGASIKTIRQSDLSPSGHSVSPRTLPDLPATPTTLEPPTPSGLSGILGGVPRFVNSVRSRERLRRASRRPLEESGAESGFVAEASQDPHGGPSVAVSTTLASGQVDRPAAFKGLSPRPGRSRGPSLSEVSEVSEVTSPGPFVRACSPQDASSSTSNTATIVPRPTSASSHSTSPPSPSRHFSPGHSKAEAYLYPEHSSSEDFLASLSQSTSNPSIPSVISASSSVAPDDSGIPLSYPFPKIGSAPSNDSIDHYGGSTDDSYDGDNPDDDSAYDDDSEDDFIVMGTGKKKPAPVISRSSVSISNAELARKDIRKSFHAERRRSARSGSNGTVTKVDIPGEPEQHHR